jgi:hypothetical protein
MVSNGWLHSAVSKHEAFQQRVGSQAIGAVQSSTRHLAARIEACQIRLTCTR